jgi:hypothetical protein
MSPNMMADSLDLQTITDVIACSPIVVVSAAQAAVRFPAGFDQVDIAVLHWISRESRRAALARH